MKFFYTPVLRPVRAAKSIIDVGFDRLVAMPAEALRLLLLLPAARQHSAILIGAIACSAHGAGRCTAAQSRLTSKRWNATCSIVHSSSTSPTSRT